MTTHTRESLAAVLRNSAFAAHADEWVARAAPSIVITRKHGTAALGQSRFGGQPDLPADFEWPRAQGRSMSFLCQLNFAEAATQSAEEALPSNGHLVLFYDEAGYAWGFDPADREDWRVEYFPAGTRLERRAAPKDVCAGGNHKECVLRFERDWVLPEFECDELPEPLRAELTDNDERMEQYGELWGLLGFFTYQHRLLGYAQPKQGDMKLECQLVSNGIYCGDESGMSHPRARALAAGAADWRLLLQIDTDEEGPEWMWGDLGRLYLMIRDQDLRACAFDRSWLILQCA